MRNPVASTSRRLVPRPELINRKEKHDVIREAEGVLKEVADLAPQQVGDDPDGMLLQGEEVAAALELARAKIPGVRRS